MFHFHLLLVVWINNPFSNLCSIQKEEKNVKHIKSIICMKMMRCVRGKAAIFTLFFLLFLDSKFIFHEQIIFLKTKRLNEWEEINRKENEKINHTQNLSTLNNPSTETFCFTFLNYFEFSFLVLCLGIFDLRLKSLDYYLENFWFEQFVGFFFGWKLAQFKINLMNRPHERKPQCLEISLKLLDWIAIYFAKLFKKKLIDLLDKV